MMAGLCFWFTAGRGGLAQNPGQEPSAAPTAAKDAPGRLEPARKKDASLPERALGTRSTEPLSVPLDASVPGAVLPAPPQEVAPDPVLERPARATVGDLAPAERRSAEPLATDDPDKNAQAFVAENRKLAEAQLKTLTDEAERLRARLKKVNSGIKRWQALLEALKQSENAAVLDSQRETAAGEPAEVLEPAPSPIDESGTRTNVPPDGPRKRKVVSGTVTSKPSRTVAEDNSTPR
jgi:hypothetical protein